LEKDEKEKIGKLAVVRASAQLGDSVSVTLLPGVEIGEQSLIPAGVVVSSDKQRTWRLDA
jgi:UDP-3-O-[3-hydroxymyristoyl] glucosamine N-acyltransferase